MCVLKSIISLVKYHPFPDYVLLICTLCYYLGSYGDKTPKSALARAYASLWMIIGLILMSVITAQVSSTITADGLKPLNDVFGDKVY